MVEFLSSVGFDFNESSEEKFLDELIEMLEFYEKNDSYKITANGKKYLVLTDGKLEMLFPVDEADNANIDEMDLLYKTDRWQKVTDVSWWDVDEEEYISVANAHYDFLSLNVCVPHAYKTEFNEDKPYKMQVACFGQECNIYTEDEFNNTYPTRNIEAFFNIGSFENSAACHFNGKITEVNLRKNDYSKKGFYHLVIKCLELKLDVFLNQQFVPDNIAVGKIACVGGWLNGVLQEI